MKFKIKNPQLRGFVLKFFDIGKQQDISLPDFLGRQFAKPDVQVYLLPGFI